MTNKEIYESLCDLNSRVSDIMDGIRIYSPMWWSLCKMHDNLMDLESQTLINLLNGVPE